MSAESAAEQTEWTIGRLLDWTSHFLQQRGVEDGRLSSEILLAHTLRCRRIDLYTRFDQSPEQDARDKFRAFVERAVLHEPIAYLVGEKEFFSLAFAVNPDVLIPRGETELLVECVVDHCSGKWPAPNLLDVGTGSGCIAVATLMQMPEARCVATDLSDAALRVAEGNAERHGVQDRMTLVQADGLAIEPQVVPDGGFHMLMSNPPYVAADEVATLDENVRAYEPRAALTDEADGLSFYRAIVRDGPTMLAEYGAVIVEVGDGRADEARDVLSSTGRLAHRATHKDRVVGQDRVLVFEKV